MNREFSDRLVRLRNRKRPWRSVYKTAELMGLSCSALRRYEMGIAAPTVESLALIADYYQVSMDFLWGRCEMENFSSR